MLLLVEIFLTAKAWRKGWGARALWPMGVNLIIGFLVGLVAGLSGSPPSLASILPYAAALDLTAIGVLAWMAFSAGRFDSATREPAIAAHPAGVDPDERAAA